MKKMIASALKYLGLFNQIKKVKLWSEKRTRGMMKHYSNFISKDSLVFDIGANTGNRTEVFLGLRARVIAVEPQPQCVELLRKQFHDNNIEIVQKAVSEVEGKAKLSLCDDSTVLSTMSSEWKNSDRFSANFTWSKEIEVETTTLDRLIHEYGTPIFCKIDVEGFEFEVISGLTKKIPVISFEFTEEFIEKAEKIIEKLEKIGNCSYNYSLSENHHLENNEWVNRERLMEELNKKKNGDLWGDIYVRTV
jgi:FkbM family methyltransferase